MTIMLTIASYDPTWPELFAIERARIAGALGDLVERIDHNGSTAVPGLAAKPVIDIQISVRRLQPIEDYGAPLAQLGYEHVPHPDDAFCPFFHHPASRPHTHHVHVVQSGGLEERKTLAFRDYLREHPLVAREYEDLKRALARRFEMEKRDSEEDYAEAKTGFVARVTERALSEGFPRDL